MPANCVGRVGGNYHGKFVFVNTEIKFNGPTLYAAGQKNELKNALR